MIQRQRFLILLLVLSVVVTAQGGRETLDTIPWSLLQVGSSGHNVVTLKRLLRMNGIDTDVGSQFDEQTKQAVIRFQTARNLSTDGIVGPKTWKALLPSENLRRGSANREAVYALQEHLRNAVQASISLDGIFGEETDSAVRLFQEKHGLTGDGIVGRNTWHAMLTAAAPENTNRLTHQEAMQRLNAVGITLNRTCYDRYKEQGCTSLEMIRPEMIEGLINLHNASGCNDIVVTGGTEIGHSRGSESHFNGYKIDIRSRNPGTDEKNCISRYIEANYSYIGNRQGDNAELYQDRRNVSNPDPGVYAHESRPPHWDIR